MHKLSNSNRLNAIDALRGIAALVVLFFHARLQMWVGLSEMYHRYGFSWNINAWIGYLTFPLKFGNLGVELFFVLSGYCIHRNYARNLAVTAENVPLDWKHFYIRRLWRIYPTYFCALLLTATLDVLAQKYYPANTLTMTDNSIRCFSLNLLSLQGIYSPTYGSNISFWTLSIELHLYLVYPLLYWLTKNIGPQFTLLITFVIGLTYISLAYIYKVPSHFVFFIPYWFTWTIGFYVAEIETGRIQLSFGTRYWLIIGMVGGLALRSLSYHNPESGISRLLSGLSEFFWALFFGGVLLWSLSKRGKEFWSHKWGLIFASIGVFSFSLYAIHYPCLTIIRPLIFGTYSETLITTLIAAIICIIVAYVFFNLVERWSLKVPKIILKKPLPLTSIGKF